MAQIRRFNPPPNPAKITDSRAAAYIAAHGEHSWGLDALPPRELNRLVEAAISGIVDEEKMAAKLAEEERQRERMRAAIRTSEEGEGKPKKGRRAARR